MTRKWARDRAFALIHPSQFTAEELEWLEIPADHTDSNDQNPEMFLIDKQPEDSRTTDLEQYDIRKRPEVGD